MHGLEGVGRGRYAHNKRFTLKHAFFVVGKHIEDVKQDQQIGLGLVELIMKPSDPIKEKLRNMLMNMNQFRHKITKIRAFTFQMSGIIPDSSSEPEILTPSHPLFAIVGCTSGRIFQKIIVFSHFGSGCPRTPQENSMPLQSCVSKCRSAASPVENRDLAPISSSGSARLTPAKSNLGVL